jgi:shikimate dehydrogenase
VVDSLRRARAAGNVTIPHKEAVAARCERVSPVAARAGAVNTFWVEAGALVGENTDVPAFDIVVRRLLEHEPSNLTVGVLGAGGAAAGVLTAVEHWRGSRVLLTNRSANRGQALAARFGSFTRWIDDASAIGACDLVVNATPKGLGTKDLPLDPELLTARAIIVDLAYAKGETAWVRACRARGHRAIDGLSMLVEQGALAFERWFGRPPDRDVMWRSVSAPV